MQQLAHRLVANDFFALVLKTKMEFHTGKDFRSRSITRASDDLLDSKCKTADCLRERAHGRAYCEKHSIEKLTSLKADEDDTAYTRTRRRGHTLDANASP